MKLPVNESLTETKVSDPINRRSFFRQASMLGLGAAATAAAFTGKAANAQASTSQTYEQSLDTITEIWTAFLIAEDLATTFYYNGLVGAVIEDPNLAGPGGTATSVSSSGNVGNVNYLQAALSEEASHAGLFRLALTGATNGAQKDPYQTFYFPAGTFDNLASFLAILNALENAFIGAYIVLIQEYAVRAANARVGIFASDADRKYSSSDFEIAAKAAASILGVESEHRVLGRVIGNQNPANNLTYEQTDGLQSIYNGPKSAVAALTPFLTPSTGPGFSLGTALAHVSAIGLPTHGTYPIS